MNEAIIIGCAGAAFGALVTYIIHWRSAGKWVSKCADWQRLAETYAELLREVEPREARFRQALGYYADALLWEPRIKGTKSDAFHDRGRIAELTLTYDDRYKAFSDAISKMPRDAA